MLTAVLDIIYEDNYPDNNDLSYHVKVSELADYFHIRQADNIIVSKIIRASYRSQLRYDGDEGRTDGVFLNAMKTIYINAGKGESIAVKTLIADYLYENWKRIDRTPGAAGVFDDTKDLLLEIIRARYRDRYRIPTCSDCHKLW